MRLSEGGEFDVDLSANVLFVVPGAVPARKCVA